MKNMEGNISHVSDQENTPEEVKEAANQARKAQEEYTQKIKEHIQTLTTTVGHNIQEKHMMPKEAMGFDDTTIEAIYSCGYRLYNAERYAEAFNVFRTLMVLNPTEKKYLFAIAACLHRLRDYENAVKAYLISAVFDAQNPIIFFHVADCYAHIGAMGLTKSALEDVVRIAENKAPYQVLRERALLMIDSINKGTFTVSNEPQETRKWGQGDDDVDAGDDDES
jgi:type III secretion system low calcium response chaperone LcrH/SycD